MSHYEEIMSDFPDKIKDVRGKDLQLLKCLILKGLMDIKFLLSFSEGVYAKETHKTTVRIAPALTIDAHNIDNIAENIRDVIKLL